MYVSRNLLALIAIRAKIRLERRRQILFKKKRKFWVHELWKARETQGQYYNLFLELKRKAKLSGPDKDENKFFCYLRMDVNCFEKLLGLLEKEYVLFYLFL